MITKKCTKCKIEKPLDEFHKNNNNKTCGRVPRCKDCVEAYLKTYRKQNASKIVDYQARYRKANREGIRARAVEWRKENREHYRQYCRDHYTKNKEAYKKTREKYISANPQKEKARHVKYRSQNKEKTAAYNAKYSRNNPAIEKAKRQKYRAQKANNGGSFTAQEWLDLCERYGDICLCCKKVRPLQADHIIPVSKGGSSNIDNIQPLCGPCNKRKADKIIDYR